MNKLQILSRNEVFFLICVYAPDSTDFSALSPIHYPVMAEFYWLCQKEYLEYDPGEKHLYTQEMLREICLGIHSMCVGSESRYFNGHTNIVDDKFLCFGVKGLMTPTSA